MQGLSWKVNSGSQEIPDFYGTLSFITVFTEANRWILSRFSFDPVHIFHTTFL
jgi:hypothetical protein